MAVKYILFCIQESNFQTRSMLIPYDKIMLCEERVKDLEILRSHAEKNVEFDLNDGKEYIVDNLLKQNYTCTERCGTQDHHPYTEIINDFTYYAEGYHDDIDFDGKRVIHYTKSYDSVWVDGVICHIASSGFNHVKNFCKFRNYKVFKKKSIEIVEGFLVLESRNNNLAFPPSVDTVDEMYQKYYNVDVSQHQ